MGVLKIPGLASGLDTDGLVKTLMALERRPVDTMTTKQNNMTTQVNAWRDMNTRVLSLQRRIEELNSLTTADWSARRSSVSDSSIAMVNNTDSTAAPGSYTVQVNTLAAATTWQSGLRVDASSNPKPMSDPAAELKLSGTIKVVGGSTNGATLTVDTTDSLNSIVAKINAQSTTLGFTASVSQVNPGDYRLVVKGNNGAANDFSLADSGASTVAADLMLTGSSASKVSTAGNGSMQVNGTTITFADNVVKDAIGGLTMSITKTGTTTVTVSKDQQRVVDAVKKVVDQYNSVIDFMEQQTSYDKDTKKAGTLFGDPRINDLRDGIRKVLMDKVADQPDAYNTLAMVGISSQTFAAGADYSGKLTIDTDKFAKALEANPTAVRNLFNADTSTSKGMAVRARAYLDNYTKTGGILLGRADSIDKGVKLLKDDIERWNKTILPAREQHLRDQFLALEKAMSSLTNQGNWLSSQLKSLDSGSSK